MSEGSGITANGPLDGVTVIELAGIGPGPYCGQLLADMGAEVIVVDRPKAPLAAIEGPAIENRGKRSIVVDLRNPEGAETVLMLAERADVLIEGYRPGVAERLGVGPGACQARNPRLVYGRMTGWGQHGPLAERAGHDLNYLALTGALHAMGEASRPPTPPLNLVGDYGGGSLFLALGVVAGVLQASRTGRGTIVDAAIIDGVSSMMGIVFSLAAMGRWTTEREANLLDGAAPFYRCYETLDGKFVAVGAIEPQFFAELMQGLGIDAQTYGKQMDVRRWPEQRDLIAQRIRQETRDAWAEKFSGSDACVTPVLSYLEAAQHPHNIARGGHVAEGKLVHPGLAPRFVGNRQPSRTIPERGSSTREILAWSGLSDARIEELIASGAVAT